MRRKFKLKVSYTFNGCFTLRAASGKEAARLVSEQCGTVLSAIQTTLGEESEVVRYSIIDGVPGRIVGL